MFQKCLRLSELLIGAFLVLFIVPMKAEAGFTHVHTPSCYTSQTFRCYDHSSYSTYQGGSAFCDNCGCWRGTNIYGTMDHCNRGYVADSWSGSSEYCQACGAEISNSVSALGGHWATENVLSCGKTTETEEASVELHLSIGEWTNQTVSLSASVNGQIELEDQPYSFDHGATRAASLEITENGTYDVTVYAKDGRTATETITVSTIDKTPPYINVLKDTDDWSEGGVWLSVECLDDASGIDGISFDDKPFDSALSYLVTQNGTHTVSVRDKAGNVATASLLISNVGRNPAVIAAEERARIEAERAKAEAERAKAEAEQARFLAEQKRLMDEQKITNTKTGKLALSDQETNLTVKKPADKVLEDVSANDLSENDVSQNAVTRKVNTTPPKTGPLNGSNTTKAKTPTVEIVEEEIYTPTQGFWEQPKNVLSVLGAVLVAAGLGMVLTLSFVYKKEGKRISILGVARVKREANRLIVTIPPQIVETDRKYRIFYSLFVRSFAKTHPVYIVVDEGLDAQSLDRGNSFTVSEG